VRTVAGNSFRQCLWTRVCVTVRKDTPLSYGTTAIKPSGTQQSVSFTGTASGASLSGTLTVDSATEQLTATIGSDAVVSAELLHFGGGPVNALHWYRRIVGLK
jgi:hypothetical protein